MHTPPKCVLEFMLVHSAFVFDEWRPFSEMAHLSASRERGLGVPLLGRERERERMQKRGRGDRGRRGRVRRESEKDLRGEGKERRTRRR